MSDRFVFHAPKKAVEQQFGVHSERDDYFDSNFNITPGTLIPVVYREDQERKVQQFLWGLLPSDADEEREGAEYYETTIDQMQEDDWQAKCLQKRRCLIPAHGFYKWKTTEKKSTPFYIRLLANELMAFAGIYGIWESSSGRKVYSCSIITTDANALVQPVGERMPVIIDSDDYEAWLADEELSENDLDQLIRPYPMSKMAVNRVSEEVNDTDKNNPDLIQPIPK